MDSSERHFPSAAAGIGKPPGAQLSSAGTPVQNAQAWAARCSAPGGLIDQLDSNVKAAVQRNIERTRQKHQQELATVTPADVTAVRTCVCTYPFRSDWRLRCALQQCAVSCPAVSLQCHTCTAVCMQHVRHKTYAIIDRNYRCKPATMPLAACSSAAAC